MAPPRSKPHARVKNARRVLSPDEAWAEGLVGKMRAACHPWQLDAVDDPHRRVSLLVGRGGGKTTALMIRAVTKCLRKRKASVLYFATTRMRTKELIWSPLKDLCDRLGLKHGVDVLFNETELRCTFTRTGSTYQLSGMSDLGEVDKWRGQSFDEVQIDEAASHREELLKTLMFEVVGPRMKKGPIVLVGSAGHVIDSTFWSVTAPGASKHRPYKDRDIVEPATWSSHWWTLELVCGLPGAREKYPALWELWEEAQTEFIENAWGPDNPIRKREYGAVWARDNTTTIYQYRALLDDGTPWNQWDPEYEERGPDRVAIAKLPLAPDGKVREDWLYALVTDHGAKDPFACNVFAASPSDPTRTIYHVYAYERPGMYARRIAILLLGPKIEKDLDAAHADPGGVIGALGQWPTGMESDIAQLGQNILDELSQVYGIRFLPAEQKGKLAAIELVNSDLVDGRLKILKGSALAKQLEDLQWVKDEYGFPKEDKAQANHSADTLCYGRRLLARLFDAAKEEQPADPNRHHDARPAPSTVGEYASRAPQPRGEFDGLFSDDYTRFG